MIVTENSVSKRSPEAGNVTFIFSLKALAIIIVLLLLFFREDIELTAHFSMFHLTHSTFSFPSFTNSSHLHKNNHLTKTVCF